MSELTIAANSRVTLNFALKMEDGSVIDSNFDAPPATFVMGDGSLLPGFERVLEGLSAGSEETFVIKPEEAFGQSNPNNMQQVPRDQFSSDMELVEGLVVSFADAQKAELPGVVSAFDDDSVTVDFNHPLAGRDIIFNVKVVDVEVAAVEA